MITEERLRQTFSEGGAQEIYQEVKASGDFLGFARRYAFSEEPMEQREQSDKQHLSQKFLQFIDIAA